MTHRSLFGRPGDLLSHPTRPVHPAHHETSPAALIAIILGMVVAFSAFGYLAATVISGGTGSSTPAAGLQIVDPYPNGGTSGGGTSEGDSASGPTTPTPAEAKAIRAAMQQFVDGLNSHDVQRIRASVCAATRAGVTHAPPSEGDVVLERLFDVSVDGDDAASTVVTHLTAGERHSASRENDERFTRENGVWLVCPGAADSVPI